MKGVPLQVLSILSKNTKRHLADKKKLAVELVFPVVICALFSVMKKAQTKAEEPSAIIISSIFFILLKIYLAMLNMSAVKELITLFLLEREQKHRQYQMLYGLNRVTHTLSNLFYMGLYLTATLMIVFLCMVYWQWKAHQITVVTFLQLVFSFGAFVISSLSMTLMLTAFFRDHKMATDFINMLFTLSSFLVIFYSAPKQGEPFSTLDYLAMLAPNSSFSIAILYDKPFASLLSLSLTKIYLLVYTLVQFGHPCIEKTKEMWKKAKNCCFSSSNSAPESSPSNMILLNEEIEMKSSAESELRESNFLSNESAIPFSSRMQNRQILIKVEGVSKTYQNNGFCLCKTTHAQGHKALDNVKMAIKKGEIFCLLGRNGAGKTTLVDILTGITEKSGGVFSINFTKAQEGQRLGICYQSEILYEQLSVLEHLYFYAAIKDLPQSDSGRDIERLVELLGLTRDQDKRSKELSGGNKRKLSVAIALLGNPELLIFDEPTSGLDPLARRHVWEVFEDIKKEFNCSILLTTHHLDEAETLADYVTVMDKGKVIVESTSSDMKKRYGNGYYVGIQFLGSETDKRTELSKLKNSIESELVRVEELGVKVNLGRLFVSFAPQLSDGQIEDALISITDSLQKHPIIRVHLEANTLEQSLVVILNDSLRSSNSSVSAESEIDAGSIRPCEESLRAPSSCSQKTCALLSQICGMFLRCVYFHKGELLRFLLTYNLNIVVFVVSKFFNNYLAKALTEPSKDTLQGSGQKVPESQLNSSQASQDDMIILNGYIFMAAAFIMLPVYENEHSIRKTLNARGTSPFAYWMGTFSFDYLCFLINLALLNFLIAEKQLDNASEYAQAGIAVLLFSYTFSLLFQKAATANKWFIFVNIILGFVVFPIATIAKSQSVYFEYTTDVLKFVYPFYDLSSETTKQTMAQINSIASPQSDSSDNPQKYVINCIVFYASILIFVEYKVYHRLKDCFMPGVLHVNGTANITMEDVSKNYGEVKALQNVSYELEEGENLALLGHNGAGKSTTFSLISGQILPSEGQIGLLGIRKPPFKVAMDSMGICYQQNSLWENLTVQQILDIFSFLITVPDSSAQFEWILSSIEFETENLTKRFTNLSGGNKRKVCLAIALFANPSLLLLDECTTGLDPSSKAAMISTIKLSSEKTSTLFTTHSMLEAEDVCQKTVIMSNGSMLAYDHILALKQKHFDCFWICLQITDGEGESEEVLQSHSQEHEQFDKNVLAKLKEDLETITHPKECEFLPLKKRNKFRIEFKRDEWKVSEALKSIRKLKLSSQQPRKGDLNYMLEHFWIVEPKLEDVYIHLTRGDEEQSELQGFEM